MLPLTLACSACGDMIFRSQFWWADGAGPVLLAFLLDAVLLGIVSRVKKQSTNGSRAALVLPALLLPLAGTLVGIGTIVGVWALVAVALVATGWSVFANRALGAGVVTARSVLVALAIVAAFATQWPARRETRDVARIAAYVTMLRRDESWVLDELKQRPDAATELAALFQDPERLSAPQALVLHARYGYPAAERAAACARMKTDDAAVKAACGAPAPHPAPLPASQGEGGR